MIARKGSEPAPMNQTTMKIESDREIVIARIFNGPARIVFDAWTRPELVRRWWAPKSHRVSVASCEADVRAGGTYRYVLRLETGAEIGFSGQYTEVTPPQGAGGVQGAGGEGRAGERGARHRRCAAAPVEDVEKGAVRARKQRAAPSCC